MADIIELGGYSRAGQMRIARTSSEAGIDHLPMERSAPLKAWGSDVLCAILVATCVAMAITWLAVLV
jgi:hypothetical protein